MSYKPLPPDSRPLLDRIQDIWNKDLHKLPVHKDLPRLAGGFEIVDGNTKRMIYKERAGENRALTCKDIIWTIAAYFPDTSDKEEVEKLRLAKLKEREKVKSVQSLRDTHDERDIFECEDIDDDDDEDACPIPLRSSDGAEEEMEQQDIDDDSSEEYMEQAEAHYISNRTPVSYGKPTKNLFANKIAAKYSQHVRGGDLSVQLQQFLLSDTIDPYGKCAGILKCIQQEIICPPVMDLRMDISQTLPYKDVKGTWYVRIELYFEEEEKENENDEDTILLNSPMSRRKRSNDVGMVVHTPGQRRRTTTSKPDLVLLSKLSSTEEMKEEKEEKSISMSPTTRTMAGAKRFLKRTHSLPGFEGSLPTKVIRDNLSKSKLSSPPPKSKESDGRRKLKESSPLSETKKSRKHKREELTSYKSTINPIYSPIESRKKQSDTDEEVEIEYRPIRKVRVLHRKREQSLDEDPTIHVEFEWELGLTFGPEVNQLQDVSLWLTDVSMGDAVPKERKEQIFQTLNPYSSKEFPFVNIWKRAAGKLLTNKYVQNSARICTVIDCDGHVAYEPTKGKVAIFYFLRNLVCSLEDIAASSLAPSELKLLDYQSGTDHSLYKCAKSLISSYSAGTEGGALARILKAVCKEILVPASSQIKNLLAPLSKDMKTIKGSKQCNIRFFDHTVLISHQQRNTCTLLEGNTSDRFFVFEWKMSLTLNRDVTQLLSVSLDLIEYSFSVNVSPSTRQAVIDALSSWITTETVESSRRSIPVDTAVRCLSAALLKLPSGKEIVHDAALPGGKMSAVALLDLLHEAMLREDLPSIPCAEIKQGGTR